MSRGIILAVCAVCVIFPARILAQEPAEEARKIQTKLNEINQKLDKLTEVDQKMDDLRTRIIGIDNRVFGIEQSNANNVRDIRSLKSQVDNLLKELDSLRGQMGNLSTSMKPSPARRISDPAR